MAKTVLEHLQQKFGKAILEIFAEPGNEAALVECDRLAEIAQYLRSEPDLAFDMPVDCTAVDWLGKRELRFDVVYHLYSMTHRHRIRLKVRVSDEHPNCPSLTSIWPGMNWHEREAWDLYGIRFIGHPNLKRVLMYEEFKGHPLRKDYPIDRRQPLIEMREVAQIPTQRNPSPEMMNKP